MTGCSSDGPEDAGRDLISHGVVHVQTVPAQTAELSAPRVVEHVHGIVEISGRVRRPAGFDGPVDGHVHIDVVDPASGEVVEDMSVGWQPDEIPTTGARESAYRLDYLWSPPPGTVLRVAVVDDNAELSSGAAGDYAGIAKSGGGGSGTGGSGAPGKAMSLRAGSVGGNGGRPMGSANHSSGSSGSSSTHVRQMHPRGPHVPGGGRSR